MYIITPLHITICSSRKTEAELQNGLQHGDPAAPHHQVLHGGAILQHDPAACRNAEDSLNQK